MAYYSDIVVDDQTKAARAGVSITVYKADGTLAALTDGAGLELVQPLITNATGFFSFNTTDAVYTLKYRYGGRLVREDEVIVGNPPAVTERGRIDVTRGPYNAVFDGRDNTAAIKAAIAAAASAGGGTVVMPGGTSLVTSTILIPGGVSLVGKGRTITRLYKTSNFGAMIQLGTAAAAWQGGRIADFWAYHDYGTGPFSPPLASSVTHPSGSEAILDCYGPYNGEITNIWATGGAQNIRIRGGVASIISNVATSGVFDPTQPGLQFSLSGLRIDKGPNGELPTNLRFVSCYFGGTITSGPVNITWPDPGGTGPYVTTSVVRNIGPERIVDIRCCESISFEGCYFGSAAKHNIALNNTGDILSGFATSDCFMDASHEEMVAFEGNNASTSISLHMHEWVGQFNCFGAVTDKNYTGPGYSVRGLEVTGLMRAFVGPPIRLQTARRVTIRSDIGWYNVWNFYTGLSGYNCGVHLGAATKGISVSGLIGGDNAGDLDTKTVVGANIIAGASVIDTAGLVDGGLAGSLVVGGFRNTGIRIDDANFTLTQRVNACHISHLGALTAERTITLSSTKARDGDTWHVYRSSTGAFNLNVLGVEGHVLTGPDKWVTFRYYADVGQVRRVAFN